MVELSNIDEQINEAEEKIEKLKTLKAKQEELKQLEAELGVTVDISTAKPKEKKEKHPKVTISPRTRKVIASVVAICLLSMVAFIFVTRVEATNPVIVYTSPADSGMFADTNDGDGVNWVVNASDADNDILQVCLWSNSSGSWVKFYSSGALGGVAYHNVSGQNGNWTGSWTKYYWNASVEHAGGGTWYDSSIHSFTTGYQWGDPQMAVLNDALTCNDAVMLKNATGDYYLFYECGDIDVKTSDTGTNWSLEPKSADIATGSRLSSCFTYNNQPYVLFYKDDYLNYAYWHASSWSVGSTGIPQASGGWYANHADCIYYDGIWNMFAGRYSAEGARVYLYYYTGTFPTTWSQIEQMDSGIQYTGNSYWYPSFAVFNGTLHAVYKDVGCDLHWETFDGVSWTDKGDVGGDSLDLGGGITSGYQYYGCSIVKDPVNGHVVCVYINNSGDLMYRVTDNTSSWSDPYLILSKGAYDIRYPHIEYIDHRLMLSFSYNLRGNYNIYTISAPDYSGKISGFNYTLNRIQWPDASPGDTNVNSTVFSLKNINNRSIKTITWHFEDIGEIANASNIGMWTNMSGSWASIGTTDASGNIATLDISGLMAGSGEWIPGQTTYWKAEILAIGSPSEDIHSTDEDIYYKITF